MDVLVELLAEAAPHAGLGGEVHDHRTVGEEAGQRRVDHVGTDEVEAWLVGQAGEVRFLVRRS